MSRSIVPLTPELHEYVLSHSLREPQLLADMRVQTASVDMAQMQIAPEQGQFMALLLKMLGAKRIIEVGTYTGYSALWLALALPKDGKIVACDISKEWTDIAEHYWQKAGVADKIDLRIAPANNTLQAMIDAGQQESYDFAFIDADKSGYETYYEQCLTLIRPGGVIACDNIFQYGKITDANPKKNFVRAMQKFNQKLHNDQRVDISIVPIADGLTLAYKKNNFF